MTSPPYWSLRDYGIEPVIWDAGEPCEHQWDDVKARRPATPGDVPSDKSIIAAKYKDNYDTALRPSRGSAFCVKCGAWKGRLGLEPTPELFIKHLCDIFDEIKRVLRDDGTIWVNLGDTYSNSSTKSNWDTFAKYRHDGGAGKRDIGGNEPKKRYPDTPTKSLVMIPQRFALEMINRGWILRNVIIWHKNNCMPSSASDRFTIDFEYIYFFSKNAGKALYWYNKKTGLMVGKKPPGLKGIEGIDWDFHECPRCKGTKKQGATRCSLCKGKGIDPMFGIDCQKCNGTGYHGKLIPCKKCKEKGVIKRTNWVGRDYYFEQ